MNLYDSIVAFRDHFKMAKVQLVDFGCLEEDQRRFLEEFYDIVVEACEKELENPSCNFRIYGATKTQALGENFRTCRSLTHRIVEVTESRLIGVNVLGGLSLNEINRRYDYPRDCEKPFCFVWQFPIEQIVRPAEIPTFESIKLAHELQDRLARITRGGIK